jgi:adenylate kinase family enzyme
MSERPRGPGRPLGHAGHPRSRRSSPLPAPHAPASLLPPVPNLRLVRQESDVSPYEGIESSTLRALGLRDDEGRALRPLVVEIVGPWGVGKGTLLHALGAADPAFHLDVDIWHLPRTMLARSAAASVGTAATLFRAAGRVLPAEMKQVVKIDALHEQVATTRPGGCRALIIDEGPVFGMSTLLRIGHDAVATGGLSAWWARSLRAWADAIDVVVRLDAPNEVLAHRIRERRRHHPLQSRSDAEIHHQLDRYRVTCTRVLDDLGLYGGPSVMEFRTDQLPAARIAERVRQVLVRELVER